MCSFPALSLQPAEPLRLRVWSVCGAWHGQGTTQWTWKAMQTPRHSLMYAPFCPKKGLETQKLTIRTPQLPPTPHSFSALRIQFISIMEKRKSASTRIVCGTSTNSSPLLFFFFFAEGANQTACLTKFMQVPLLKRKRKKKGHVWIMNLCWEWTSVSVSLSIFFFLK